MLAPVEITPWHWAGFIVCVLFFLALDLGVFHRKAHVVKFKEALLWSTLWFCLAMAFALLLRPTLGKEEALEFLTGYILELSLSMDNVFVIALIFAYFGVPSRYQHRVLFWGILGALIMRGVMIGVGAVAIQRYQWILYFLGVVLIASAIKMIFVDVQPNPERNIFIRFTRKFFRVSKDFDGQKFLTHVDGRVALTPMTLVLVMVETTDLIFAVDSIPAIFAVTQDSFIVFTSNVFAILGLRSLYFVLAGAIDYFRYLKIGLSIVLAFIGAKMLLDPHGQEPSGIQVKIPTGVSLLVVAAIILTSIALSIAATQREKKSRRDSSKCDEAESTDERDSPTSDEDESGDHPKPKASDKEKRKRAAPKNMDDDEEPRPGD
jgi:tellurite resistance protein TerC